MPSPQAKAPFALVSHIPPLLRLLLLLPVCVGTLTSCGQRERLLRSIETTKQEIELAARRADDLAEEERKLEAEVLTDINNFALAGDRKSSAVSHNSARALMAQVTGDLTQEAAESRKRHKIAVDTLQRVRSELAAYRAHVTAHVDLIEGYSPPAATSASSSAPAPVGPVLPK